MNQSVCNVLILCTGNSARSIMGEALVNALGQGRFRGFNAGSRPKGQVHPMALEVLGAMGLETAGLRSKSWDAFSGPGAPQMDVILTVCDNAAGESCPVWIGHPVTAHWGIADPAAAEGEGQRAAFLKAYKELKRRIERLVALPVGQINGALLRSALQAIHDDEMAA